MGSCLCKSLCNANGSAGWVFVVVIWVFFFSPLPRQRLTREHLLEDKIKKPVVVYFEGSVFAFTSCWRELLCCCQQINKIRALF